MSKNGQWYMKKDLTRVYLEPMFDCNHYEKLNHRWKDLQDPYDLRVKLHHVQTGFEDVQKRIYNKSMVEVRKDF